MPRFEYSPNILLIPFSFLALLVLTACGGSGGESAPPSPPPIVNTAPTAVADRASTLDSQSVRISVLSNDSDADADNLTIESIVSEPESGTVTIDDTEIVYTPNEMHLGNDSFIYQVSDGNLTSSAEVTIINSQQFTINGNIALDLIDNAEVVLSYDEIELVSTTSSAGEYSFSVMLEQPTDVMRITASKENSPIDLAAIIGDSETLLLEASKSDSRIIDNNAIPALNPSFLSSAVYLAFLEDYDEFNSTSLRDFINTASTIEILNLAGFLHLVATNDNYPLLEGQSLISWFTLDTLRIYEVLDNYVYSLPNGSLFEQSIRSGFNRLLDSSKELVVEQASNENKIQVGDDMLGTWVKIKTYRQFLSGLQEVFQFGDSNRGIDSHIRTDQKLAHPFTWQIENNVVNLTFEAGNEFSSFPSFDPGYVAFIWGDDVAQFIIDSAQSSNIQIDTRKASSRLIPILKINDAALIIEQVTTELILVFDEETSFVAEQADLESHSIIKVDQSLIDSPDMFVDQSWAMPSFFEKTFVEDDPENSTISDVMDEIWHFSSDQTLSSQLGFQGEWSFSDGILEIRHNDVTTTIMPFIETDIFFGAIISIKTTASATPIIYASRIVRQEPGEIELDNLITELPITLQNDLRSSDKAFWAGSPFDIVSVFGWSLFSDGTAGRTVDNSFSNYPDGRDRTYYFENDRDRNNWKWSKTNNSVTLEGERFFGDIVILKYYRNWDLLSVDEDGLIKKLQSGYTKFSSKFDGVLDQVFYHHPRIESIYPVDLSEFEDAWEETLSRGGAFDSTSEPLTPENDETLDQFQNMLQQ